MLAIKLQRVGKKHQPSYRFVVAERRSKMAGPPLEDLGAYNPFTKASSLNKERVSYWIKMGAQPTLTVHNLLVEEKVVSGVKRAVKMKKEAVAEAAAATPASAVAQTPAAAPAEAPAQPEAPVVEAPETKEAELETKPEAATELPPSA